MSLKQEMIAANGQQLHVMHQGEGDPILFLHGFPAFSYVWRAQLDWFSQRGMWAMAPDGRGVNRSSKPDELSAYDLEHLAADIVGLADSLGIDQFALVGHDWGGGVAWEVARRYSQRVSRLIVANAPPFSALRYALATIPEQAAASEYMDRLKADTAEAIFLADNCARLWEVSFTPLVARGVYAAAHRVAYQTCWQIPGSLTGFLNWYRANIPPFDAIVADEYRPRDDNQIHVPTLLLWGEHERAFTPALLDLIPQYVPQLDIQIVAGANHWIHLEQPGLFNEAVWQFVSGT